MLFRSLLILNILELIFCTEPQVFIKWQQINYAKLPRNDSDVIGDHPYFIRYNNVPQSVVHHKDRLFITLPRRMPSVVASLTVINLQHFSTKPKGSIINPSLNGYPNYTINELHPNYESDPNRIVSVYRPRVDVCNRLWFVDTGMLEYPGNPRFIQRPSIWVIDLNTDKIIRRYEIPASLVENGSGMISIAVDADPESCDTTHAYIPDLQYNQLLVYSFKQNHAWRFTHNYFHMDPLGGDFEIANIKFQWDDGIFSIALGNKVDENRPAYFHPFCSNNEFVVSTKILKDESLSLRSYHEDDFKLLGSRGVKNQSASHGFHTNTGILFFTLPNRNAIGCINMNQPFDVKNFDTVYQNNQTLIYPADLSIDAEDTIWFITNSMPKFIYSKLDPNEFNFRIWRMPIADAIKGTLCEFPSEDSIVFLP